MLAAPSWYLLRLAAPLLSRPLHVMSTLFGTCYLINLLPNRLTLYTAFPSEYWIDWQTATDWLLRSCEIYAKCYQYANFIASVRIVKTTLDASRHTWNLDLLLKDPEGSEAAEDLARVRAANEEFAN